MHKKKKGESFYMGLEQTQKWEFKVRSTYKKPRKSVVNIIWSQNVAWTNHEQVKFTKPTWLGLGKKPPQLFYSIIDN